MERRFRMEVTSSGGPHCSPGTCSRLLKITAAPSVITMLACTVALAGCTKSKGPTTVEVTGAVTLDGNPVEGANVLFAPPAGSDDRRLASQATTDSGGKYHLQTHIGAGKYKSGIVPGKYEVTVV